jgi:hypothetical protein
VIPEKRGSTPSLNFNLISVGVAVTTPPTGGAAFCNCAWAKAVVAAIAKASEAIILDVDARDMANLIKTGAYRGN